MTQANDRVARNLSQRREIQIADLFDRAAQTAAQQVGKLMTKAHVVEYQATDVLTVFVLDNEVTFVGQAVTRVDVLQNTDFAFELALAIGP